MSLFGEEIPARTGDELVRFVRALGKHRYVASRLHLVHLFAIEAAHEASRDPALAEAAAWAERVRADPSIDRTSKDERLARNVTDAELVSVLSAFWAPETAEISARARAALTARLTEADAAIDPTALPFDDEAEEDVFPVLVDAGWELLPLAKLDPERHKGAIDAFEDFEIARFEEENAVPPPTTLHELPAFGATELLFPFDPDDQGVRAPFVLWCSGNETYLDYVLRGLLRAAKLA